MPIQALYMYPESACTVRSFAGRYLKENLTTAYHGLRKYIRISYV
jgi:hypothetical protein